MAVTRKLRDDELEELAARVARLGGQRLSNRCEGTMLSFARTSAMGGTVIESSHSCACRERSRLELPFVNEHGDVELYIACANCDAVAEQPVYAA